MHCLWFLVYLYHYRCAMERLSVISFFGVWHMVSVSRWFDSVSFSDCLDALFVVSFLCNGINILSTQSCSFCRSSVSYLDVSGCGFHFLRFWLPSKTVSISIQVPVHGLLPLHVHDQDVWF
eukprot:16475_1